VDERILLEILRTELRDDGVQRIDSGRVAPGQGEPPQAYLRLALPCEPDFREATLRAEDPVSLKAVERRMEFDDLPPSAKPRAVALGLAELLRGSWPWLAMLEPPLVSVPAGAPMAVLSEPPEPTEPSSSTPDEAADAPSSSEPPGMQLPPDPGKLLASLSPPSPPPSSPWVQLGGKALWFFDLGNPVWGGQVLAEHGRWSLGAQLLTGSASSPRGEIALRLVSGTLGFTVLELSSESIELRSGVSLAVGRASVGGTPLGSSVKGARGAAPYLGAMLSARTRWWFSSAWACTVEAEAGRASGIVATVDGQEAASLAGWLGGLSLGLSFAP
jgi:hypothetical protein